MSEIQTINYKKGLSAMAVCYGIWGLQPLYFALDKEIDTAFLLACRIVWASVSCVILLACIGRLSELKAAFKDRFVLKREIPASLFLFADWAIYLIGIKQGRVMECVMGYYIMPLVMVMSGALLYKEQVKRAHYLAFGFIVVGIVLSYQGFGTFPLITISLSLAFAVYSAIKKSLTLDSIVSTTLEVLIMLPFAVLYILLFRMGEGGMADVNLPRQLFIMGCGLVTALPMIFFSRGLKFLPLSLIGILQYCSPTLGLVSSMILGEVLTKEKLISFIFIWCGVIIYSIIEVRQHESR